jgi:hypothetical protein
MWGRFMLAVFLSSALAQEGVLREHHATAFPEVPDAAVPTVVGSNNPTRLRSTSCWSHSFFRRNACQIVTLSLRGGGKRKPAKQREERMREALAQEWKRQGLEKIDVRKGKKKDAAREGTVAAVQRAKYEAETFEDFEARQSKAAWKIADLRRRAQEPYPWARWGKKWREQLGVPEDYRTKQAAEEFEDSDLPEGWPKLRKINDGMGNLDYEGMHYFPI